MVSDPFSVIGKEKVRVTDGYSALSSPVDLVVKFEKFGSAFGVHGLEVTDTAAKVAGEVVVLIAVLRNGTLANAVRQDGLQLIELGPADAQLLVDDDTCDRLTLMLFEDAAFAAVEVEPLIPHDPLRHGNDLAQGGDRLSLSRERQVVGIPRVPGVVFHSQSIQADIQAEGRKIRDGRRGRCPLREVA